MTQLLGELPPEAPWARRGPWPRFTPEVERAFARHHEVELLRRGGWAALAAMLVMLVYTGVDAFMVPCELRPAFLWGRGLFVILPLAFAWWASFQPWALGRMQLIGGAVAVSAGLTIAALVALARRNGTPIAYEGIILTLFYFYCCGGLRLPAAACAGLVVLVAYPLLELQAGLPPAEVMVRATFLATTNGVGMISAALMENSARHNFALAVQLNNQASRDFLTGLLNRRALRGRFDLIWRNAVREGRTVTVAMIDVDHFKAYNDHHGHSGGDEVLRRLARVLQAHAQRPLDAAARYGGEEFVCIWTGNDAAAMGTLLERIQRDVRMLEIGHAASPLGQVSLSMGVVQVQPQRGTDVKAALREADALLYRAKKEGRNRVVFVPLATKGQRDAALAGAAEGAANPA